MHRLPGGSETNSATYKDLRDSTHSRQYFLWLVAVVSQTPNRHFQSMPRRRASSWVPSNASDECSWWRTESAGSDTVRHDGAQQRRRTSMDYLGLGLTLGNATLRPCMRLQTTQHQRRRETSCMVSLEYVHPPSGVLVPLVSIEAHPACHASSAAATLSRW